MGNPVTIDRVDWSNCPDVERIPGKVSGQWLVKGTRILVNGILENAAAGYSAEEIASELHEGLSLATTRVVLDHARRERAAVHSV